MCKHPVWLPGHSRRREFEARDLACESVRARAGHSRPAAIVSEAEILLGLACYQTKAFGCGHGLIANLEQQRTIFPKRSSHRCRTRNRPGFGADLFGALLNGEYGFAPSQMERVTHRAATVRKDNGV
jgi:hypothetical protein